MSAPLVVPPPGGMTYAAFNNMLDVFLSELCTILGDREPGMRDVYAAFKVMTDDPSKQKMPMEMFMMGVSPHARVIQIKDETFITGAGGADQVAFLKSIHLDRHWAEFEPDQKDAMWQFLNQLLFLGTMFMSIPEPAMAAVENVAMNLLRGGGLDGLDPSALFGMLQQGGGFPSLDGRK